MWLLMPLCDKDNLWCIVYTSSQCTAVCACARSCVHRVHKLTVHGGRVCAKAHAHLRTCTQSFDLCVVQEASGS